MIKNLKNKKIILDVDTGVDDALAIILLSTFFSQNIIGITTCGGNTTVAKTTQNTLSVLSLLNKKIPVYPGSIKPLTRKSYISAEYYHGHNGLANINLKNHFQPAKISAIDFLIQSAKKYQKKLVIIGIAPATNIAKAILKDKNLKKYLSEIYLMGGAVKKPGNETPDAETNFFQDPEAIKIILDNIKKIYLIPLDATNSCTLNRADLKKINQRTSTGKFVFRALKNWFGFFGNKTKRDFELYDPLAVSVALGDFLTFKKAKLTIDCEAKRGKLIPGKKEVSYAYKTKNNKFKKLLISTLNTK